MTSLDHKRTIMQPSFLELPDNRRIAYHLTPGRLPGVIFMGGFKSDMTGSKALALETFCKNRGQRFLRFDYTGHGESSGRFVDGTIGSWKQDMLDVLDQLTEGKSILIGSSMGAWIMLLAGLTRPEKVLALIGIASAPDFTEALVWKKLQPKQKQDLEEKGVFYAPSCNGEDPYPITMTLIKEARTHLLLDKDISIFVPVRLLHGLDDQDVPWQNSISLMEKLQSNDIRLQLIKGGNHRLSEPEHLELLCATLEQLLLKMPLAALMPR